MTGPAQSYMDRIRAAHVFETNRYQHWRPEVMSAGKRKRMARISRCYARALELTYGLLI